MAQHEAQAHGLRSPDRFVVIEPQDLQWVREAELEHLVEAHATARWTDTRHFLLGVICDRYGSQAAAWAASLDHITAGGPGAGRVLAAAQRLANTRRIWHDRTTR